MLQFILILCAVSEVLKIFKTFFYLKSFFLIIRTVTDNCPGLKTTKKVLNKSQSVLTLSQHSY